MPVQLPSGRFSTRIPDGDNRERPVCDHCGFVVYDNPRIVTGSVVTHGSRILLCRRAIRPRHGFWTLPAGYMELRETAEAAALREAWEEAEARIEIDSLLAVYSIPRISMVQIMFRARLIDPAVRPGTESLEVALFDWDEIPWSDLAFPSVHWALTQHRQVEGQAVFAPFTNPPGETGDMTEIGVEG
jgi:ADP-ribose pyrophosphatase YjhB (NUDIX family)